MALPCRPIAHKALSTAAAVLTLAAVTVPCRVHAQGNPVTIDGLQIFPSLSSVKIAVDLSQKAEFKERETSSPSGLVIEIPRAGSMAPATPFQIGREPVRRVTVHPADGDKPAAVELEFSSPATWQVTTQREGRRIVIEVSSGRLSAARVPVARPATPVPPKPAPASVKPGAQVTRPAGAKPAATPRPAAKSASATAPRPVKSTPPVDAPERRRTRTNPSSDLLDCSFKDTDLHDVIQTIARLAGVNIIADASVQGKVTLNLTDIGWEDGLRTAVQSLGYSLRKDGSLYVVGKAAAERPPTVSVESGKLSVSATQADVKELLALIAQKSGLNIVASPAVDGKLSVQLTGVTVEDGVYTLLTANGFTFRKMEDIYVVDKLENGKSKPPMRSYKQAATNDKVSIDFKDTELSEVLAELGNQTGKNIVTYGQLQDKVTIRLTDATLDDALRLILAGTKYSSKLTGSAYVVGDASNLTSPVAQMLTSTEIIPLKYIKAEEYTKYLSGVVPTANVKPLLERNALMVVGTEEMVSRIKEEIGMVDRAAPQVMIEAQVVEISSNASLNMGFDLQGTDGRFTAKLPATGQVLYTSTAAQSKSLIANLQLLMTGGKARVLANPKVTTINGKEANINISQQRYFRTASIPQSNTGEGNQVPTYYYPYPQVQSVEAGIMLKIVPFVGASDEITVDIQPEVSNVTGTGPDGLPEISRRKASTTVRVRNGETIIIGGLKQREQSKAVTRTPILGDIPIIGELFKSKTKNTREADLMILITPTLITTDGTEITAPPGSGTDSEGPSPPDSTAKTNAGASGKAPEPKE